jgi:hypothetical protein
MATQLGAYKSGYRSGSHTAMARRNKRIFWGVGLLAAAAATVGAVVYFGKHKVAGNGTANASLTVAPGPSSVSVTKGGTVNVNLPTDGSNWQVQFGAFPGGLSGNASGGIGTDPLVLTNLQGSGTIPLLWIDGNGTAQRMDLSISAS